MGNSICPRLGLLSKITSMNQSKKFISESMGWLYENTETSARRVAEVAQNKIDQLEADLEKVKHERDWAKAVLAEISETINRKP